MGLLRAHSIQALLTTSKRNITYFIWRVSDYTGVQLNHYDRILQYEAKTYDQDVTSSTDGWSLSVHRVLLGNVGSFATRAQQSSQPRLNVAGPA
jgi:hypothetical protein